MLSKDVTWLSQLAAMTAELTAEQAPVKQAPMLTVAMVMALELYVVSDVCVYSVLFHAFISHTATSVAILAQAQQPASCIACLVFGSRHAFSI